MYRLAAELFPICRSITGDGVRQSLSILREIIPLELIETPTGAQALDWTIPDEWNIRDAYIIDPSGRKIADFKVSNLHVLNYSAPIRARVDLEELRAHLHTLPERPHAIPYRTSYFKRDWGFCLPDRVARALPEGDYEVCVDSTLAPGALTYGELFIPGAEDGEVLFSAHVCHPSLANDNLSAMVVATHLAARLLKKQTRLSYRFLFAPGTIGALAWLERNRDRLDRLQGGLVLNCLGDQGEFTYKRTFAGDNYIDRAVECALQADPGATVEDFIPYGYDERQYNAPGFRAPVGAFSRTTWGRYPEYHTSDDNLDLIQPDKLEQSLDKLTEIVDILERNRIVRSLSPYGEPQLGRRGLYDQAGGARPKAFQTAVLWVLSMADGAADLMAVARRSGLPFTLVADAADALAEASLVAGTPAIASH
ncbi:MAG: DUF4910 domain-containing protein [Caulobacteraceae bacterium]